VLQINLPRIFYWYPESFGGDKTSIVQFVKRYLPHKEQAKLDKIPLQALILKYAVYDWSPKIHTASEYIPPESDVDDSNGDDEQKEEKEETTQETNGSKGDENGGGEGISDQNDNGDSGDSDG